MDKLGGESYPAQDGFMKIVRIEPLGVTAGITSFNGPIVCDNVYASCISFASCLSMEASRTSINQAQPLIDTYMYVSLSGLLAWRKRHTCPRFKKACPAPTTHWLQV